MCEQPFGIQIVDSVIALFGAQNFSGGGELVENEIVDSVIALFGAHNFSGGGELAQNEIPDDIVNSVIALFGAQNFSGGGELAENEGLAMQPRRVKTSSKARAKKMKQWQQMRGTERPPKLPREIMVLRKNVFLVGIAYYNGNNRDNILHWSLYEGYV
ncbi:hypothetical protein OROGR_024463 [Orobanche gracilis]